MAARESAVIGKQRRAGIGQGVTVMFAAFLPILAIVGLAPAVPSIIGAFVNVPGATTLVPLAVTAPGLMIALFSPLMGWLADRHGRRRLLLGATLLYGVVGLIPFFVASLSVLIASRLALGICEAAILTVTNTLIGDYFSHDERRGWLTFQGVIGPIFGTGTVFLAGFMAAQSWQLPFAIYAVAFPISLLMLVFLYEPDVAAEVAQSDKRGSLFPWGRLSVCCGFTLFAAALYYVYIVQVGRAFGEVGVTAAGDVGIRISIASIGVVIGAILFQWVSRRFPSHLQLMIFLGLLGAGLVGIGLSSDAATMTVFSFIQQLGAGILIPSLVLWTVSNLPPEHRGRGMGIWSGCFFLGQFVSPLLVTGSQAATGSIQGAFLLLGIVSIVGAASTMFLSKLIR